MSSKRSHPISLNNTTKLPFCPCSLFLSLSSFLLPVSYSSPLLILMFGLPYSLPSEISHAEIRHDRGNQRAAPLGGRHAQLGPSIIASLIAVEDGLRARRRDQPVRLRRRARFRFGRSARTFAPLFSGASARNSRFMLRPSVRDRDREHLGAQFPKHGRGDLVCGAMRAIERPPRRPSSRSPLRKLCLTNFDVAAAGTRRAAWRGRARRARARCACPLCRPALDLGSNSSEQL